MTSASVLIVLLVGTVVGALVGLFLGSMDNWYLALLAGFLGSTISVIVRNLVLSRGAGLGPDDSKTPFLVLIYAGVASLGAGSLALEIARRSGLADTTVWIGTLAGLFASILLAMLMVTYHANPGQPPTLKSKRHH